MMKGRQSMSQQIGFPFFFFLNLTLADASAPLQWKPNDLRPASSPPPPPTLFSSSLLHSFPPVQPILLYASFYANFGC